MNKEQSEQTFIPQRKVIDEIKFVLPQGGNSFLFNSRTFKEDENLPWALPPLFPPDLFAVVGHICKVAGIIGYYDPNPNSCEDDDQQIAGFKLTLDEKKAARKLGKSWRKDSGDWRQKLQENWNKLFMYKDEPIRSVQQIKDGISPRWWKVALLLLIVADHASKGLGRHRPKDDSGPENPKSQKQHEKFNRFNKSLNAFFLKKEEIEEDESNSLRTVKTDFRRPATLGVMADRDAVCVLPKGRVSSVGCTLRNISANLSLLPPRGEVRCHWLQTSSRPKNEDHEALDILLIPIPYQLNGLNFKIEETEGQKKKPTWGNFEIEQTWLSDPNEILSLTKRLLIKARKEAKCVNGIVFPEYALNYEIFEKICDELSKIEPKLEFIISGSSDNCENEKGNYVLTAVNYQSDDDSNDSPMFITSRRKHHRWCLNRSQVSDYALATTLNPSVKAWWEKHHIAHRELYFHQFRSSSTFVSMICEDLARNDPCHEIIRSIGPNLLFALLMDGPQLPNRWSARYASSLADDPGCAVLTFTSYGLVERMNSTGKYGRQFAIGLWKDETGNVVEVKMPDTNKQSGVLLSLSSRSKKDRTIDGRKIKAKSWRFESQMPIVLEKLQADNVATPLKKLERVKNKKIKKFKKKK